MRRTHKSRPKLMQSGFNPHAVTLFGIHAVELAQTAAFHSAEWSGLHTALAVGMVAAVIERLKAK